MWGSYVVLGLRDHPEPSPGLSPSKYTLGPDVPQPQDQGDKDPEQSNKQECRKWGRSLQVVVLTVGKLGRLPAGLHEGQWAGTGCWAVGCRQLRATCLAAGRAEASQAEKS